MSWLRSLSHRVWLALSAASAVIVGLLPHVLHHAGPLAGAALFAGVGGSLLFGALGLLVAIPFLRRLHRRSGGWRVPATVLILMIVAFSISSFVIGPAINGEGSSSPQARDGAAPATPTTESSHASHH